MLIPGTKLAFELNTGMINDAQTGLLLLSLLDFACDNKLGGQVSRGCGAFEASLQLLVDGRLVTSDILIGEAPRYALSNECADYVSAAEAALAAVDLDELEALYPLSIAPVGEADVGEKKPRGRKPAAATEPSHG
jgi:CRISPR type IV-associated protein Csf2